MNVPFHISPKFKSILTRLVDYLKTTVPYGRPALLDYFTDEYEKIKIAEALAFCGDIGCYLIGLTDLQDDIRSIFIDLLKVSGKVVNRTVVDDPPTPSELREAERLLVRIFFSIYLHISSIYNNFNSITAVSCCIDCYFGETGNCTPYLLEHLNETSTSTHVSIH